MPKFKVEMHDGNTYMVEADTPPTEEEMSAFIEAKNNETPLLVEAGNAFSRAAISTLGLPGEAINLARNVGEYATGTPWAETTKMRDSGIGGFGFDALDNAFGENGLELYKTKDLGTSAGARMAQRVGGLAGGIATGGLGVKQSLPTMARLLGWGTAGGTIGGEFVDPRLPEEYQGMGEAGGQLLGLTTGALRSIKAPAPKPGLSDATLNKMVKGGKGKVSAMNTEVGNELDMATYTPPTPEAAKAAEGAQGILNQLQLTKEAGSVGRKKAAEMLAPVKEVTKPGLLDRAAYATGTASNETAYKTAIYDAIKEVEDVVPKSKTILGKLAKEIPKHIYLRYRLGKNVAVWDTGSRLINELGDLIGVNKTPSERQLEALKKLETIIRTGEPIPTKGTAVKRAVQGAGQSASGLMNSIAERYGVDASNGAVMGSGPLLIKPSSRKPTILDTTLEQNRFPYVWHGSPHDHNGYDPAWFGKGEGNAAYGNGLYTAEARKVGTRYATMHGDFPILDTPDGRLSPYNMDGMYRQGLPRHIDKGIMEDVASGLLENLELGTPKKEIFKGLFAQLEEEMLKAKKARDYTSEAYFEKQLDALNWLEKTNPKVSRATDPGTLYFNEVQTNLDSMVDFDRPVSAQSSQVKEGLFKILEKNKADKTHNELKDHLRGNADTSKPLTGEKAYRDVQALVEAKGKDPRLEFLTEGIQGNKYFDGYSRAAKSGTFNYVVHDPAKVKILEKMKIPLYSIGGGAFLVQGMDLPNGMKPKDHQS